MNNFIELENEKEANISFTAVTLFYGFIRLFIAQILVFAVSGIVALIIAAITLRTFQSYMNWAVIPTEGLALYLVYRIVKKSFTGRENFMARVKVDGANQRLLFFGEKILAKWIIITGIISVAWLYFMNQLLSGGNSLAAPICFLVILSFGSVFMLCFLISRLWILKTLRFDSIAGLATIAAGIWKAYSLVKGNGR